MAGGSARARFDRAASVDLRQAALWYEEKEPGLGARFAAVVRRAVQRIEQAPERWPLKRGLRRYVLPAFPYTIAYRHDGGEVTIVAIAHQRLDPRSWEGR